jgi:hypothetical protein
MNGGTTFHFVTDGIRAALERASEAANGGDIRLGGGEHLLADLDVPKLGYQCTEHVPTANATHVVLAKRT